MKIYSKCLKALLISNFIMSAVIANDSTATLDSGGIVLQKSQDIVMEKEALFISQKKIKVKYIFRNTSSEAITTRVAFPLPSFPEEPERDMPIAIDASKPMQFSLKIAGKNKSFDTEIKRQEGKVMITHHWMQTFPANQTLAVEHEYIPAAGHEMGFYFSGDDREKRIKRYCIEPKFQTWIDKNIQPENDKQLKPSFVHYVLKTGANWKGEIGEFQLTIKKSHADEKISLCASGLKKQDELTFVMKKSNFIPKNDLKILFLRPFSFK